MRELMVVDEKNGDAFTVAEVARESKKAAVQRDKEAVDTWRAAATQAPTREQAVETLKRYEELSAEADQIKDEYAQQCVRRALVYGWQRVAEEQGVSAKILHSWHKQFAPKLPDLSAIPGREMKREERRIAALEKQLAVENRLRERYEEAQKRLAEIKKGVSR